MRLPGLFLIFVASLAHADRYGLDELESASIPGWMWAVMFVGLLGYHLWSDGNARSESARLWRETNRLAKENRALTVRIEAFASTINLYLDGETTDEQFCDAAVDLLRHDSRSK